MKIEGLPKNKDAHRKVAERMMDDLAVFSNWPNASDKTPLIDDITSALDGAGRPYDGYDIAKNLDDFYWNISADMVSELDFADRFVEEELTKLISAWVEETGYKHPYAVGDNVAYNWGGKKATGTIHEIRMNGNVLINLPEGNGCAVVSWESVEPITTTA